MEISVAYKDDYYELAEVWEASVRATHDFVSPEDILSIKPLLSQYFDAVDLFLIREQGKVLGFLGTAEEEVQMLFLHPDAIGKGIGKFLMQFAINECHATKVEVNEQNDRALGFYKHFGFEFYARSAVDHLGKPYPLLSMRLDR